MDIHEIKQILSKHSGERIQVPLVIKGEGAGSVRASHTQEGTMRMLALATAAAAALAFTAPAFTTPAFAQDASVKVKVGERHHDRGRHEGMRHRDVKKVVLHRDHGRHEGWRHSRHHGASKVVIKKGHGKTVIKKKFEG